MRFNSLFLTHLLALAGTVSAQGLHGAFEGLLQMSPSFGGDGISLFPAHHPDHDPLSLTHLIPDISKELYYSQEGHRPAMHGAKHGSLKAVFARPTVVLDHSTQIKSVQCSPGKIQVCFKSLTAFDQAILSWALDDLNLVTYHNGCGDETSGKRTFFHAVRPEFDLTSLCMTTSATSILEEQALESGEIRWGTYLSPSNRRRVPVKGHMRLEQATPKPLNSTGGTVDLSSNATALDFFFGDPMIDGNNINKTGYGLGFISENGTVPARRSIRRRALSGRELSKRGGLFEGIWEGIRHFIKRVGDFFGTAAKVVTKVAGFIRDVALLAADLIAVPFGVPFERSYHNDFRVDEYLTGEVSNKPPKIFGIGNGFTLAKPGKYGTVQCAKCGIHANFDVDGELAFSIKKGLTKGKVTLINNDPFVVDAQFGITLTRENPKSVEKFKKQKQWKGVPLSPLSIPGIITVGPQVSISTSLDLNLVGKAELLVGGSLTISKGSAVLSLVNKTENALDGLAVDFTPATGSITATAELGVPIAVEVGVDVLNGKFKKTVGLVDTPAIYIAAEVSTLDESTCKNGLALRAGIKNKIHIAALDLWDYEIRDDVIFEQDIACLTSEGIRIGSAQPDKMVFSNVTKSLDSDYLAGAPKINDVAAGLKPSGTKAGFRIVMDKMQTSILVSGKDSNIYLAGTGEQYDLSAPWGTLDAASGVLSVDVFGRIMSCSLRSWPPAAVALSVHDPKSMPKYNEVASLTVLKTDQTDFQSYGVLLSLTDPTVVGDGESPIPKKIELFYPTACKSSKGLQIYGTRYLVDKDGKVHANDNEVTQLKNDLGRLGVGNVADCRTIYLTSASSS